MPHRKRDMDQGRSFSVLATILLVLAFIANTETCSAAPLITTQFIMTSCGLTTYPDVCIKSLSSYSTKIKTNYSKLAYTALTISLKSTKSVSSMVSKLVQEQYLKPNEAAAVKDCVENMGDSIDELRDSLREMKNFSSSEETTDDLDFKMSNVKTWLSAALSEDDTCLEGLDEEAVAGKVKSAIRSRVAGVAQLTSNALALVNNLNYSTSVHSP